VAIVIPAKLIRLVEFKQLGKKRKEMRFMAKRNRLSVNDRLAYSWIRLLCLFTISVAQAQNPVPLINEPLVPDALKPGSTGFTLTVNGTGFVSRSVVMWNGNVRATTYVSSSCIKATILSSDVAKRGAASVTVSNPGPGGGTSNVGTFEITSPNVSLNFSSSSLALSEFTERPVLADVNRDGKLDLIGEMGGTDVITVRLGNGDGTFQGEMQYPTAAGPNYPLVGDFNSDGKIDIAVLCESGVISILLGNADGTFQSHIDSPIDAGLHNFGMAAGDLNGDGKLDLVVGYQDPNSNSISVLFGNGDGTFRAPVDYAAGFEPGAVTIADLNGDGKLDIVAANFGNFGGNTVSVLLGNGDGTFQPQVQYATSGGPLWVIAADFNHDGKLDLAVDSSCGSASRCGYPGSVSILLGNGDGTFHAHVDYPVDAFPYSLAAGDLTGRGVLDLAVTDLDYNELSILLGHGDGTFAAATTFPTSSRPVGVVLADLNNDGRLDAVVGTDAGFSIFLQAGTVALSPSSLVFGGTVLGATSAAKTIALTNVGATTVTIISVALAGTNVADFAETNTCRSSLPPNAHCTISVSFSPSQLGPRAAAITFTDSAPGSPQSVPLSGFGVTSGANATVSSTSLTFSTQLVGTSSPPQAVTVSNYGTQALSVNNIVVHGDFNQSPTCGSSLVPLANCTIVLVFKPTQRGNRTGTLSITDNAPNSPQTVNLKGTGTVVELNPASLVFGLHQVGTTSSQSTTLTNVGSTALSIAGIAIRGTDADEFSQTNTCGSSVGAGKVCTITVTFKPSEKGGDSAAVAISDSGGGSPQTVSLSGSGCVIVNHRCKAALSRMMLSALAASQTAATPVPTGPSMIGTRIIDFVDSTRDDPFSAQSTKRELLVRFWYPASLEDICKLAEYASPRVWNYFAELTRLPLPKVSTNACLDAPVANSAHPVIVFTHGYTGTFTDYTFLAEDLASRGYIVVSIDHTYEATAVEFPDGRFVKSLVGSHLTNTWQTDDQTLSSALAVRLDDVKFVIDELERLNESTGTPFAGRLDLTRLALAGHSLGGLTAWFGVQRDARFKAAVVVDPYLPNIPVGSTGTPIMLLTMGGEHRNEDECQLWSDLRGPRLAVNLRGAEHVTPSDLVWLAKGAVKTGTMSPEKTIAAVRDYIAAFLDANLQGRPAAGLLNGPSSDYPDAVVTTQDQALCHEP
jgi:dienelactone hydrolase